MLSLYHQVLESCGNFVPSLQFSVTLIIPSHLESAQRRLGLVHKADSSANHAIHFKGTDIAETDVSNPFYQDDFNAAMYFMLDWLINMVAAHQPVTLVAR